MKKCKTLNCVNEIESRGTVYILQTLTVFLTNESPKDFVIFYAWDTNNKPLKTNRKNAIFRHLVSTKQTRFLLSCCKA